MLRIPLRIAALLFSLVTALTVLQLLQISQDRFPSNTTARFELSTGASQTSKDELVSGLNRIAETSDVVLVKASASATSQSTERDLIYFGATKPEGPGPVIRDEDISWLTGRTGRLIPAASMGQAPITGEYATTGGEEFFSALSKWATQHQVEFRIIPDRSIAKWAFLMATNSGLGAAWIASIVLIACVTLAWFVLQSRTRSLQLLGGVPPQRIHLEDNVRLAFRVATWAAIGAVLMCGYVAFYHGVQHVKTVLPSFVTLLLVGLLLVFLANAVFSFIARPTVEAIRTRTPAYRTFARVSRVLQVLSLIMVMVVLPTTVGLAQLAAKTVREGNVWEQFGDSVTVSVASFDFVDTGEGADAAQRFFEQSESAGIMEISARLDSMIDLSNEDLSGYDAVAVVNPGFLATLGVGVGTDGSKGSLAPIAPSSLSPQTRQLLADQFSIWVRPGVDPTTVYELYQYDGPGLLTFDQNVGRGGDAESITNPLVVLVREPAQKLKANGFLMNLMSTGNLFFTDGAKTRELLAQHGLFSEVSSIDRFADVVLTSTQQIKTEMLLYLGAAALLLTCIAATAWQSALIWTERNRRRIFTLRTAGQSFAQISSSARRRDLISAALGLIIGSLVALFAAKFSGPIYVGIAALLALALYAGIAVVSYAIAATRAFSAVVHREN